MGDDDGEMDKGQDAKTLPAMIWCLESMLRTQWSHCIWKLIRKSVRGRIRTSKCEM